MSPTNDIESVVVRDILDRQQRGIAKYGQTVAQNPLELREWLQHAYEECLDQAVYLRRAIEEIESGRATEGIETYERAHMIATSGISIDVYSRMPFDPFVNVRITLERDGVEQGLVCAITPSDPGTIGEAVDSVLGILFPKD